MSASSSTDRVVMADVRGISSGASGWTLEGRERLCNTLFVPIAGFGHGGGLINLIGVG